MGEVIPVRRESLCSWGLSHFRVAHLLVTPSHPLPFSFQEGFVPVREAIIENGV